MNMFFLADRHGEEAKCNVSTYLSMIWNDRIIHHDFEKDPYPFLVETVTRRLRKDFTKVDEILFLPENSRTNQN